MKRVKDMPEIDTLLPKGIAEAKVNDLRKLNRNKERNIYRNLISKFVKDKQLVNILAREENVRRYRNRLSIQAEVYGQNPGEKVVIKTIGKHTLNEFKNLFMKRSAQGLKLSQEDITLMKFRHGISNVSMNEDTKKSLYGGRGS